MAETGDEVVIGHAHRLHEGIDNGGANKIKDLGAQLFRDFGAERGFGLHFGHCAQMVLQRAAIDKIP